MVNNFISEGVYYIGVDDVDIKLFEGQYEVPLGMSYNSYAILDDKIAVLDTVDARKSDEWMKNLDDCLGGRKPDYLVIHHVEPDHSGTVRAFMEKYADCTIVCSQKAVGMLENLYELRFDGRVQIVKEGDTLSLGSHELSFVMAPMIHWPEVMVSYDKKDKILFSADAFGKFGALSREDEDDEGWACEARRYYFNICGKYGAMVQNLLKKASAFDISVICPLHGPVLTDNISYYLGIYNTWSKYEPEDKGIFIAYCSLHGNTATAANKLAEIIREMSDVKVSVADIVDDDIHEAVEDAFRYDRMVLAAPTYDGDLMPVMADFLNLLKVKAYQNRKVALIENGSWAPMAGKKMRESLGSMKNITVVEPVVTIMSSVKDSTIQDLRKLAETLIG